MSYHIPKAIRPKASRTIWISARLVIVIVLAGFTLGIAAGAFVTGCRVVSHLTIK
jgi:hypothetical protein